MKKTGLILIVFLLATNIGNSQNSEPGSIQVTGYAELEIVPDEIYYTVEIADKKEGKEFIQLDIIENKFLKILDEMQIDSSQVSVLDTYNRNFQYKRKKEEIIRSKKFEVRFKSIKEVD